MDVGLRDRIAAQLRFVWSHEYSDTARPVTATFVGAPAVPFTVQGAAPTRDGAVIGFSASTAVADAASVYVSLGRSEPRPFTRAAMTRNLCFVCHGSHPLRSDR